MLQNQSVAFSATNDFPIRSSTSGPVSFNLHIAFVNVVWLSLRLLWAFAGVLREKSPYMLHFKGNHGKLYIVGKVNECRFWEKTGIAGFLNSAKENCKQPLK